MSTDRTIVVLSLVYVGALVALSRSWLGDVRAYVQKATGRPVSAPTSSSPGAKLAAFTVPDGGGAPTQERAVVVEFLVGYAVLWLALTAMTEVDASSGAAAALAVAIASGASILYLADAASNLGLSGSPTLDASITTEGAK